MARIGFIGGGNMAEALIKGVIGAAVFSSNDVIVSDIRQDRLEYLASEYQVNTTSDNCKLAADVDILVLSIKPQMMSDVLGGIKTSVKPDSLIISIAAGVRIEKIAAVLVDLAIIRVMPNTTALISEGATAIYANEKANDSLDTALKIFGAVGAAVVVEDERLIDAVTAVSGSGPAYFFLLIEEMIKTATDMGLSQEVAEQLVLQTARGAAMLAVKASEKGETPADLRRKVTSPGGTTEAAIDAFVKGGFSQLITTALGKAREKSEELSK